ncbi:MAG: UDP-2,4-diacetamido-2,4,6-trideoxy-beta-L-altropyranose hydrolase [Candidatus Berkiella sp.]
MVKKRFLIRVDASNEIGHGHAMRCLTLAESHKRKGAQVEFVSQDLPGNVLAKISEKKIHVHILNNNAINNPQDDCLQTIEIINKSAVCYDWIIVDNYLLDEAWQKPIFENGKKIFVIDDLAKSNHYCTCLLNQTFGISSHIYNQKINNTATILSGEKYVLLRAEFAELKPVVSLKSEYNNPLAHFFWGATDINSNCYRFAKVILENIPKLRLRIVMGSSQDARINTLSTQYEDKVELYRDVSNMAETMLGCNIAIGAPGMATWERAAMGLPGIYFATSPNQIEILKKLDEKGFCFYLGEVEKLQDHEIIDSLTKILQQADLLAEVASHNYKIIDALGANRVADFLLEH